MGDQHRRVLPVEFRHRPVERQEVRYGRVETDGEDVPAMLPAPGEQFPAGHHEQVAQEMDDLLWSFKPESFIPHAIVGIDAELTEDEDIPVFIGYQGAFEGRADLLINLGRDIPDFHGDFARIAEIVPDSEPAKANLREHWNSYKASGFTLAHHNL